EGGDRSDRHLRLESEADVDRDKDEEDDKAAQCLARDLLAPRGADVGDAHLILVALPYELRKRFLYGKKLRLIEVRCPDEQLFLLGRAVHLDLRAHVGDAEAAERALCRLDG